MTIPEGTLSLHGDDLTVAFSNRQDAEVAYEVIEKTMTQQNQSPVVADEMVERAKQAVWNTDAPEYQRDYLQYDHIMRAALEAAQLPARPVVKALGQIHAEASMANEVIRLNRDGAGQGRVKVATAMHRIARWAEDALSALEGEGHE